MMDGLNEMNESAWWIRMMVHLTRTWSIATSCKFP